MAKQKSLQLSDGPLTGKKIYYWKVGKRMPQTGKGGKRHYQCKCKCGTEKLVADYNLSRHMSKSCGCRPFKVSRSSTKFKPRFFGNFYVKSLARYKKSMPIYTIECSCGKTVELAGLNYKYQIGCSRTCPHTIEHRKQTMAAKRV